MPNRLMKQFRTKLTGSNSYETFDICDAALTARVDEYDLLLNGSYETPQMYGAKGDGVTDDYSAIQDAIIANKGKTLYFPNGTYKISQTLQTYPSNENHTNIILANEAVIVPSAQMDYVVDIGSLDETFTEVYGRNFKLFKGGKIDASNGNVSVAVIHLHKKSFGVYLQDICIIANNCNAINLGEDSRTSGYHYLTNVNITFTGTSKTGILIYQNDCTLINVIITNCAAGADIYSSNINIDNIRILCNQDTVSTNYNIGVANACSLLISKLAASYAKTIFRAFGTGTPWVTWSNSRIYSYDTNSMDCYLFDLTELQNQNSIVLQINNLQWRCAKGTNSKTYGIRLKYSQIAKSREIVLSNIRMSETQNIVPGDILYGFMQSNSGQPMISHTSITDTNKWYLVGGFIGYEETNSEFVLYANDYKTTIPINVRCNSASNMTAVPVGNLVTNDTRNYQIAFQLSNSGFDSSLDVPRINVYVKYQASGTFDGMEMFYKPNSILTPLTKPGNGNAYVSSLTGTLLKFSLDCSNKTITSIV